MGRFGLIFIIVLAGCNLEKKVTSTTTTKKVDTTITIKGDTNLYLIPLVAKYDSIRDTCLIQNIYNTFEGDRGQLNANISDNILSIENQINDISSKIQQEETTTSDSKEVTRESEVANVLKWATALAFSILLIVIAIRLIPRKVRS